MENNKTFKFMGNYFGVNKNFLNRTQKVPDNQKQTQNTLAHQRTTLRQWKVKPLNGKYLQYKLWLKTNMYQEHITIIIK